MSSTALSELPATAASPPLDVECLPNYDLIVTEDDAPGAANNQASFQTEALSTLHPNAAKPMPPDSDAPTEQFDSGSQCSPGLTQ